MILVVHSLCRCEIQSMRVEDYMNLSLDLVPRGSVRQCLEEYLKVSINPSTQPKMVECLPWTKTCFLLLFPAAGGQIVISLRVWCSNIITEVVILDPAQVSNIRFPIINVWKTDHSSFFYFASSFCLSTCDLTVSPPSPFCQQRFDPPAQKVQIQEILPGEGEQPRLSVKGTGGECRVQHHRTGRDELQ